MSLRKAALFLVVTLIYIVPTAAAYALSDASDKMCSPYYAECGCDQVPDPKNPGKCKAQPPQGELPHSNVHGCPVGTCVDTTNGHVTSGICSGANKCLGELCDGKPCGGKVDGAPGTNDGTPTQQPAQTPTGGTNPDTTSNPIPNPYKDAVNNYNQYDPLSQTGEVPWSQTSPTTPTTADELNKLFGSDNPSQASPIPPPSETPQQAVDRWAGIGENAQVLTPSPESPSGLANQPNTNIGFNSNTTGFNSPGEQQGSSFWNDVGQTFSNLGNEINNAVNNLTDYYNSEEFANCDFVCRAQQSLGFEGADKNGTPLSKSGEPNFLAAERAPLMAELDPNSPSYDPDTRDRVAALIAKEAGSQGPEAQQAVLERLVNASVREGYTSLNQAMDNGFYGPVESGAVDAYVEKGISATDNLNADKAIAAVADGGNICNYCTNQGMGTAGMEGKVQNIGGEYFGQQPGGTAWANQQAQLAANFDSSSGQSNSTIASITGNENAGLFGGNNLTDLASYPNLNSGGASSIASLTDLPNENVALTSGSGESMPPFDTTAQNNAIAELNKLPLPEEIPFTPQQDIEAQVQRDAAMQNIRDQFNTGLQDPYARSGLFSGNPSNLGELAFSPGELNNPDRQTGFTPDTQTAETTNSPEQSSATRGITIPTSGSPEFMSPNVSPSVEQSFAQNFPEEAKGGTSPFTGSEPPSGTTGAEGEVADAQQQAQNALDSEKALQDRLSRADSEWEKFVADTKVPTNFSNFYDAVGMQEGSNIGAAVGAQDEELSAFNQQNQDAKDALAKAANDRIEAGIPTPLTAETNPQADIETTNQAEAQAAQNKAIEDSILNDRLAQADRETAAYEKALLEADKNIPKPEMVQVTPEQIAQQVNNEINKGIPVPEQTVTNPQKAIEDANQARYTLSNAGDLRGEFLADPVTAALIPDSMKEKLIAAHEDGDKTVTFTQSELDSIHWDKANANQSQKLESLLGDAGYARTDGNTNQNQPGIQDIATLQQLAAERNGGVSPNGTPQETQLTSGETAQAPEEKSLWDKITSPITTAVSDINKSLLESATNLELNSLPSSEVKISGEQMTQDILAATERESLVTPQERLEDAFKVSQQGEPLINSEPIKNPPLPLSRPDVYSYDANSSIGKSGLDSPELASKLIPGYDEMDAATRSQAVDAIRRTLVDDPEAAKEFGVSVKNGDLVFPDKGTLNIGALSDPQIQQDFADNINKYEKTLSYALGGSDGVDAFSSQLAQSASPASAQTQSSDIVSAKDLGSQDIGIKDAGNAISGTGGGIGSDSARAPNQPEIPSTEKSLYDRVAGWTSSTWDSIKNLVSGPDLTANNQIEQKDGDTGTANTENGESQTTQQTTENKPSGDETKTTDTPTTDKNIPLPKPRPTDADQTANASTQTTEQAAAAAAQAQAQKEAAAEKALLKYTNTANTGLIELAKGQSGNQAAMAAGAQAASAMKQQAATLGDSQLVSLISKYQGYQSQLNSTYQLYQKPGGFQYVGQLISLQAAAVSSGTRVINYVNSNYR